MGKLYLFYSQETRQSETADFVPGAQFAAIVSQADLGMFSLLGRTGASQKDRNFSSSHFCNMVTSQKY